MENGKAGQNSIHRWQIRKERRHTGGCRTIGRRIHPKGIALNENSCIIAKRWQAKAMFEVPYWANIATAQKSMGWR